jgi:hypothetical protein
MLEGPVGLPLDLRAGMNGVGQKPRRHDPSFQQTDSNAENGMLPATRGAIQITVWFKNELVLAVSPSLTKRDISSD